ncbi:membrane-bound PQQ-dependent dehydrogenase, glucose/quinate/shikimate family [Sinirhodobacter populi]|uniref:Membrane-bound PQQ-dependent dehydrogenase, glucose/quinate/shikimate family n=1 Tax=Paenirhodobacter populi TaxID=2306993 RepID=A0A443JR78_9RHOB|nr:membrane-bound PQQ-dependent dehydrogenase, glucose/quinate/shikimate family [Sinirhodobacter populi]
MSGSGLSGVDGRVGQSSRARWTLLVFGALLALVGLALALGGIQLAWLGGSWYYILAGLALLGSGFLVALRRSEALWLFGATASATILWALWEAGLDFWALMPRLAPFVVMTLVMGLLAPLLVVGMKKRTGYSVSLVAALILIAGGASVFVPHGVVSAAGTAVARAPVDAPEESRWQYYGRTPDGTRFAPEAQITPENVDKLTVAWTFRTGEMAELGSENQNTPIQIGDTLYICTPLNKVFAIDADTGEERWSYDPKPADTTVWNRCRGVAYYEPSAVADPPIPDANTGAVPAIIAANAICGRRIVTTTIDARLIQLDAETGALCETFGTGGIVDLKAGMGEIKPAWYQPTSMPTVVGRLIIVGGWVFDGRSVDEPSGVVRAFNADTGALVWAWDLGNPEITGLPPTGETYSRTTPNVWSTPAFDEDLGLVFLPTGNQNPDFWGALRPELSEQYSSAIVALDIATGRERWKFQTVHHDIWDYDVPAQPALYDVPDGKGGTIPALIQLTKRGQIFMLDRRTGEPIAEVVEKPVPQEHQEGDWVSATQPYSVGMPAIGTEPLTEKRMWGATFFDQLSCRIAFRKLRYEGEFTAATTEASLLYPGYYGGMNWGSASIDAGTGYLIVNDIRMPQVVRLIPQADLAGVNAGHGVGSTYPQEGVPFGITHSSLVSFLGLPCNAPPWGTFSAIDLSKRELVWQRPAGTVEDTVVAGGIKAGLAVPLGMPTLGGPISTGSGLVFYAGTQDYYLRALDAATGEEIWKGRLPVGAQATPMTYVSPKSGRQFVVVSAGGARQSPDRGDYVVAYALPDEQ